jgi:hypothetical protein
MICTADIKKWMMKEKKQKGFSLMADLKKINQRPVKSRSKTAVVLSIYSICAFFSLTIVAFQECNSNPEGALGISILLGFCCWFIAPITTLYVSKVVGVWLVVTSFALTIFWFLFFLTGPFCVAF